MTAITFDTLAYANRLKDAGMSPTLAEVQSVETAKVINDLVQNELVTKSYLNDQMNTLKTELLKEIHSNTWKVIGLLAGLQAIFHFIK